MNRTAMFFAEASDTAILLDLETNREVPGL